MREGETFPISLDCNTAVTINYIYTPDLQKKVSTSFQTPNAINGILSYLGTLLLCIYIYSILSNNFLPF